MHITEGNESLTATDRAGARHDVERGHGKLRFRERGPGLRAEPGVPARRGGVEPPRLLVERRQQQ
jgi:hypothetical protein